MAADRSSRHYRLPTYRVGVPGRSTDAELFQPRFPTVQAPARTRDVVQNERLDTLAFRELGDPDGYWQIADANSVYDPQELLEAGRTITIPGRR